ncbi:tetratricopeptide repeat protein [Actinoplanes sp. NPDC051470]|uniref:tetratricopeptide repeat protein n=1 Tax=Actinoplanes sp. NPDC051470 TaxID=3157224 RepID=UPI003431F1B3
MSRDENRAVRRRPRPIRRPQLPAGPLKDLKDALYELYAVAGKPTLDEMASEVARLAQELDLAGVPKRDTIGRIIGDEEVPPNQHDVDTLAAALASVAGREVAAVVRQIRSMWVRAGTSSPSPRLGSPVSEFTAFALEVHRSIEVAECVARLPALPSYVSRAHDDLLAREVDAAMRGHSKMVTLVGGPSTGKTRACWEAVQRLPTRWRLWHPISPNPAEALINGMDSIGPYTVVWLNEAQRYLLTADISLSERIAAGLRELLRTPQRGPVLVLATVWPQYWADLAIQPPTGQWDFRPQSRTLLSGTDISVADAFAGADLEALHAAADSDPRLAEALDAAEAGRITQYLAGAVRLVRQYRNAPPAARAIVHVAIDACRLSQLTHIPHALLEQAAPGYLTDHEWNQTGEDWLKQALAYTSAECYGISGPLTHFRPRPGDDTAGVKPPCYRLADYLEQLGDIERADIYPPSSFWQAVASVITDTAVLQDLGEEAENAGRYHRAATIYWRAADYGDPAALLRLAELCERLGDLAGAEELAQQAADRGDPIALMWRAEVREELGDHSGAEALYRLAADRGDPFALTRLAEMHDDAGDSAGAEALVLRAVACGNGLAFGRLAERRKRAGNFVGAEVLYRRSVQNGNIRALCWLAELREQIGDESGAEALYQEAADEGDPDAMLWLVKQYEQAADSASGQTLALEAAVRGVPRVLCGLAELRDNAGDASSAETLYRQAAELDDPDAMFRLAELREREDDQPGAEAFALRAAELGDRLALSRLAGLREQNGDPIAAEALTRKAADRSDPGALHRLADLWELAGDSARALQLRQFGLDDDGSLATEWEFPLERHSAG